jgi:hypothetical protein
MAACDVVDGARSRHRSAVERSSQTNHMRGAVQMQIVVVRKALRRSQVIAFFKVLRPCLIGLESCATSDHVQTNMLSKQR